MEAALREIPTKKSLKFRRVQIPNGERILEVNGILPIPVSKVEEYLPVSADTVKRMIRSGEINAYDRRFNQLAADYKGKEKKFINLNEWAGQ